ncbi:MAG: aminotransferase class V-fold PLP-dependent enzyme [Bacteroidales bacterium]|nr:MAG: aminotransferase class V-fold PLP-dependent enzyme [Bacteroidales bacterium]
MINLEEFKEQAHKFVDWITDYYLNIEKYSVKPDIKPYEVYNKLSVKPPENGEPVDSIFEEFKKVILPGMTHWQSPNFFAYFPANSSLPSILAEMLTAALGAQCMKWETSPAATELEESVMNWLKKMTGLPGNFHGVIQDTASTSTLCALLTAREKISDYKINNEGFKDGETYRVYCSTEAHSSVDKAVKIAGVGEKNLIKIETDKEYRLKPDVLEETIKKDLEAGKKPLCVIATLGTTSSTAVDPIKETGKICKKHNIWFHIDAAFAGSALILPEFRYLSEGIEYADSFVFNPHKWLFTNFDCSAYFVRDKQALVKTFQVVPEYLKSGNQGKVNDYCDWGIQLGRRFRALKLWFVIRNFGIKGLQDKLRKHISLARYIEEKIKAHNNFEIVVPANFNLICFRFKPGNITDNEKLNELNLQLLNKINNTGKIYLSHTRLKGIYTLRMATGQTNLEQKHVDQAWKVIQEQSENLKF